LITKPDVMIYDEPTTGQDPVMIRNVDDMIEEVQSQFDITSIVISHDMVSTFRIADRVAMIYYGELLAFGTPDEMKHTQCEDVRKFIFAGSA
jgi:ABC-type transporter Mla maintaining outer membrane lipid asymmetry ATPase subunit MlaF